MVQSPFQKQVWKEESKTTEGVSEVKRVSRAHRPDPSSHHHLPIAFTVELLKEMTQDPEYKITGIALDVGTLDKIIRTSISLTVDSILDRALYITYRVIFNRLIATVQHRFSLFEPEVHPTRHVHST
jgi:hypothetical protein